MWCLQEVDGQESLKRMHPSDNSDDEDNDDDDNNIPAKRPRTSSECGDGKPLGKDLFLLDKQVAYSEEASADVREHLGLGEHYLRPCTQQVRDVIGFAEHYCSVSLLFDFLLLFARLPVILVLTVGTIY